MTTTATPAPTAPTFWRVLALVVRLRFRLATRQLSARTAIGAALAALVGLALAGALAWGTQRWIDAVGRVAAAGVWLPFSLSLLAFLAGLFWVIWPVVAAQIDEASELGRYLLFPVRPRRLYLVHTLAGAVAPSSLLFAAVVVGACSGLEGLPLPSAALLVAAFGWMCVTCGRCLQYLLLNVLTSRRSTELLGVALLLLLGLSVLLPTIDASWLFARLGGFGATERDLRLLVRAGAALGSTPFGWLARGLLAAVAGETATVLGVAAAMGALGVAAWAAGLALLSRFCREPPSARPRAAAATAPSKADATRTLGAALLRKELGVTIGNPKARLLFAVPYFLAVLLKIVGAPQLLAAVWGPAWAARLLALLALYQLSMLASHFFNNGFGYDGHGVRQVFLAPLPLSRWLRARNLAQAIVATVQLAGLALLVLVAMPGARVDGLALPLCGFALALGVSLGLGNLLSASTPRRYHYELSRRDRPAPISVIYTVTALGACAALAWLLARGAPWLLAALPPLGAALYAASLPLAARWTERLRERVVESVS